MHTAFRYLTRRAIAAALASALLGTTAAHAQTFTASPQFATPALTSSDQHAATTAFVKGQNYVNAAGATAAAPVQAVVGLTGSISVSQIIAALSGTTASTFALGSDPRIVGAAPLSSPAFTGAPTAPLAAAGDNTNKLATTSFVTRAVGAGGGGTGGAPINSPAFTGVPTSPTRPYTDTGTAIATDQFVTNFTPAVEVVSFGAICDGSSHKIGNELGVNTIAGLAAYTTPNGATPYSWINNGDYNYAAHFFAQGDVPSGLTTVPVQSAVGVPNGASIVATVGLAGGTTVSGTQTIAAHSTTVAAAAAAGQRNITLASVAGLYPGERMPTIAGVPFNDPIQSIAGNTVTLANNLVGGGAVNGANVPFPEIGVITLSQPTNAVLKGHLDGGQTIGSNSMLRLSKVLTDADIPNIERDWLAIQAAIQSVGSASTGGGTVAIPAGHCMMDNAANVGSGVATLVIPQASTDIVYARGNFVDLTGAGETATVLDWPNDLGASRYGIVTGPQDANWVTGTGRYGFNYYYGSVQNLMLYGPAHATFAWGVRQDWMDGIAAGARRRLQQVSIRSFNAGVNRVGDHTRDVDIEVGGNYCGIRFDDSTVSLYGDFEWDHTLLAGNALAAVCVSHDAQAGGIIMTKPYLGGGPYGVLLEQGPGDNYGEPGPSGAIANWTIHEAQMEWLGNALIQDEAAIRADGTMSGGKFRDVYNVHCFACYVSTLNSHTINVGGAVPTAFVDAANFAGVIFDDNTVNAFNPGSIGLKSMFRFDGGYYQVGGIRVEGEMGALLGSGIPVFSGGVGDYNPPIWTNVKVGNSTGWRGYAEWMGTISSNIVPGMIVEQTTTAGGRLGTAGATPIVGVTMQTANGGTGRTVAIASSGGNVPVAAPSGINPGTCLKKNAGGVSQAATTCADAGVVGYVTGFGGGTTTINSVTYTLYPTALTFSGQ